MSLSEALPRWRRTFHVGLSSAAHLICSGYEPVSVMTKPTGTIAVEFPRDGEAIKEFDRYQTVIDNLIARAAKNKQGDADIGGSHRGERNAMKTTVIATALLLLVLAADATAQYCPGCGRDYPKPAPRPCPAASLC